MTGMRKGFDGRAAQVRMVLAQDPCGGAPFLLRGRRGDLAKAPWWDGQGRLALHAKRLERGRFVWPQAKDGVVSLTPAMPSMLPEGMDWRMAAAWRPGGLARVGAEAGDDGRHAKAARDQQARQWMPAQEAGPRRAGGAADAVRDGHGDRPMAARPAAAGAQEHRGRGARGQAGAGGVRGPAPWPRVRGCGCGGAAGHGIGRVRRSGVGG